MIKLRILEIKPDEWVIQRKHLFFWHKQLRMEHYEQGDYWTTCGGYTYWSIDAALRAFPHVAAKIKKQLDTLAEEAAHKPSVIKEEEF